MQSTTRWCLNEASMSYGAKTFVCFQSERVGFEFSVLLNRKELCGANCPCVVLIGKIGNFCSPLNCPPQC
jgi:hypothetical protein